MRRNAWALVGAALLVTAASVFGVVEVSRAREATSTPQEPPASTAKVTRGTLWSTVTLNGILAYRARLDGSPYAAIDQATGTYTQLPNAGGDVACGDVLYRVDDRPVLLLCGAVPAYRDLHEGDVGADVRELNRNLHQLGYDAAAGVAVDPADDTFSPKTRQALEALRRDKGLVSSGGLALGDAVVLPEAVRIAKVAGELGGSARPGVPVLYATSGTLEVQVGLSATERDVLKEGDAARITLPSNTSVTGKVARLGKAPQAPAGQNGDAARQQALTIPAFISLDQPDKARGLDTAAVRVDITTRGVENVLSVPVTALVGKSGGGMAVEVARPDGRRELVGVKLGMFDTSQGRVQVEGDLREGDLVVVPSL